MTDPNTRVPWRRSSMRGALAGLTPPLLLGLSLLSGPGAVTAVAVGASGCTNDSCHDYCLVQLEHIEACLSTWDFQAQTQCDPLTDAEGNVLEYAHVGWDSFGSSDRDDWLATCKLRYDTAIDDASHEDTKNALRDQCQEDLAAFAQEVTSCDDYEVSC